MTNAKNNSRQALYLTYRPATFADLTAQGPVVDTLKEAVKRSRVAHAYLFTGPRGTGKTTTARLLAKAVNCAKPKAGEPCNACPACESIAAGKALDVLEIDAASNRGIDEIRELRDRVNVTPSGLARKVYIIDEVHMLTKEAFNALLKTLEEPPEFVTFILATTEPNKVPATIISRCQRFDLRPAPVAVISEHLQKIAKAEGLKLEAEAAELMARHARGSFRDALSVLDLVSNVEAKNITADAAAGVLGLAQLSAVGNLERALVDGDAAAAMQVLAQTAEAGTSAESFRLSLIDYLRTLMLAKVGALPGKTGDQAAKLAADWELSALTNAIRAYLAAGELMQAATLPELPLEMTTLELLHQDRSATAEPATAHPLTKSPAEPAPDTSAAATPSAPAKADTPAAPPTKATELWEALLKQTKHDYSLSVGLQKTRPEELSDDRLTLVVASDFFLKKLTDPKIRTRLNQLTTELAGRKLSVEFAAAAPDPVDDALKVFEGATLE